MARRRVTRSDVKRQQAHDFLKALHIDLAMRDRGPQQYGFATLDDMAAAHGFVSVDAMARWATAVRDRDRRGA